MSRQTVFFPLINDSAQSINIIPVNKKTALLLWFGLVLGSCPVWAGESRLKLLVKVGGENSIRLPNLYFDRYHPPKPMEENEAAFTEGTVSCRTNSSASATIRNGSKNKPCTAEIKVQSVSVLVRNETRVNLPVRPVSGSDWDQKVWLILQAHEEGHVLIYKDIFEKLGQKVAQEVFAKCPASFNISVPFCSDGEIQAQMDRELDVILDALTAEAVKKISDICRTVGEAYDQDTSHGRQGPGGGLPTVENQALAAQQAVFRLRQKLPQ